MSRLAIWFAVALLSTMTDGCEGRGASPEASPTTSRTASPAASAVADSVAGDAACVPQIVVLPRLNDRSASELAAMNDRGWAVGHSRDLIDDSGDDVFLTAVMWRDGAVIDLGLGGGKVPKGVVSSSAVDVNEDGVVVAQRWRNGGNARTSWRWQDGVKERLRGSKLRREAWVEAVNDDGFAVGYITGRRGPQPVVWRNGAPKPLPIPAGTTGSAVDINNRGVVVGSVIPRGGTYAYDFRDVRFWYWRLGGKSGPLRSPPGYPGTTIYVDNHNRILGEMFDKKSEEVLWQGPRNRGRVLGRAVPPGEDGTTGDGPETTDMNDHGALAGYRGGFRGSGEEPWVSHLGARHPTMLPIPTVPGGYPSSTKATAVIRGVTWFAPQGGVSVGGHFNGYIEDDPSGYVIDIGDAVIWTCTQTY
jgi:hypothetical protein